MGRLRIEDWSLGRVVREMEGRLVSPRIEMDGPRGISTDSRTLEEGEIFFALRGENFDGHEFVDAAVDAGASAVVVEDRSANSSSHIPTIVVDDCVDALGRLGHAVFRSARQDGMHTVALTGSNGKTTTKELLATLWKLRGEVWATPGNLNNHIGVPLTLCAIPARCDHLVVEMGANHRGEISELIKLAPAEQRIITSIGRAHLEGFGSMAGVRKAKSEIFDDCERTTTAIVPCSEKDELIPYRFPGTVVTFGEQQWADLRIVSVDCHSSGREAILETDVVMEVAGRQIQLSLPLVGRHNAWNLAAALATVVSTGDDVDVEAINAALSTLELPGGRLRTITIGSLKLMDDAYNANPSSMRASFRGFEQWIGDDDDLAVAVIGDMHELGDSADRDHRSLAKWLAARPCLNALAFVGAHGTAMAEAVDGAEIEEVMTSTDLDAVADWLYEKQTARVFIKGSRANRLERIVDILRSRS